MIRFKAKGAVEMNKRRGRVKVRRVALHMCRWPDPQATHVIMFRGKRLACIQRGIARPAERAGLDGGSPHVLKHKAITRAIMNGASIEGAAEYFDISPAATRKHYWHHSAQHQQRALDIIEGRRA